MSFSIDDLVSSFNNSHIGQEANDLAALQVCPPLFPPPAPSSPLSQAQLSEALFGAASSSSFFSQNTRGRAHQPCTTPTARSPVPSNFHGYRSRASSISRASGYEDAEDEMMVEELLMGSSSKPSTSSFSQTTSSSSTQPTYDIAQSPAASTSLFASADPFFLQTQANAQSYFYENSNITQYGRPSISSPFVNAAASQFGYHNQYHHGAMGVAS